jgi:hypothetical protein
MALIVEFFFKRKKKQKIFLPKEKTTSLKKIQKVKSTFIYLTVLISADIEEKLPKSTVLINKIELLNYKISGVFLYLVEQLSSIFVSERRNNRSNVTYYMYFFYNSKSTFTFYLIFKLLNLLLLQAFLMLQKR